MASVTMQRVLPDTSYTQDFRHDYKCHLYNDRPELRKNMCQGSPYAINRVQMNNFFQQAREIATEHNLRDLDNELAHLWYKCCDLVVSNPGDQYMQCVRFKHKMLDMVNSLLKSNEDNVQNARKKVQYLYDSSYVFFS